MLRHFQKVCHTDLSTDFTATVIYDFDDEALSWWDYRGRGRAGAVCGPEEEGMPCAWRDLGTVAPPSASCVLVDDQFAYIPRQLVSHFPSDCRSGRSLESRGRGLCSA